MRIDDRTEVIPVSHLRTLFYPEKTALLELSVEHLLNDRLTDQAAKLAIDYPFALWQAALFNKGNQSWEAGVIQLKPISPCTIYRCILTPGTDGFPIEDGTQPLVLSKPLHPGQPFRFAVLMIFPHEKERTRNPAITIDVFSKDAYPQSSIIQNPEKLTSSVFFDLAARTDSFINRVDIVELEREISLPKKPTE